MFCLLVNYDRCVKKQITQNRRKTNKYYTVIVYYVPLLFFRGTMKSVCENGLFVKMCKLRLGNVYDKTRTRHDTIIIIIIIIMVDGRERMTNGRVEKTATK